MNSNHTTRVAKSGVQAKHKNFSRLMVTSALVAAGMAMATPVAVAADYTLPSGGTVVGGSATFSNPSIDKLNINQSTNRAVINWNSFNIGTDATVQFYQPNSSALAVNRVLSAGTDPTKILGTLKANGRVMVLDRNGVVFGPLVRIDVMGIVASTGDVDTASVMAGDTILTLSNLGTGGQVINNGTITAADSGLVALVAPTVKNNGVITAKLGRVALAAGSETATVDLYGDGLVELAYTDRDGDLLSENSGTIKALGGTIQMTAAAAKDVVDSVVNMNGIAHANSATISGGKIILSAGKKVKVTSSSHVKAATTTIKAKTVNLDSTISGAVNGEAEKVNILSNNAKIAQGLDIVSENGTVNVGAGTYNEHLIVNKNGVTLKGAKAGILGTDASRGTGETIVIPNSPGVTVLADGVTVDGFTFAGATGANGYGIFVNYADNATIKNNIVKDTSQHGVYVLHSNHATVTGNNIGATGAAGNIKGDGIRLFYSPDSLIDNNTIRYISPLAYGYGSGVSSYSNNNVTITNNTISDTVWDGVKVVSGDNYNIAHNDIRNVARSGVAADNTYNSEISNNEMAGLGMWGVWSRANNNIVILMNHISGVTGYHGISSRYDYNPTLDRNVIRDVADNGILVEDGYGVIQILGNDIRGTDGNGILVDGESGTPSAIHPAITALMVPTEEGPSLADGLYILGNQVSESSGHGIYVRNVDGLVRIKDTNRVSDVYGNAIYVTGWNGYDDYAYGRGFSPYGSSMDLEISDNVLFNQNNGILVENVNQSSPYMDKVLSVVEGDSYLPTPQIIISGNQIDQSWYDGIALYDVGGYVKIDGNTVHNSRYNGVEVHAGRPIYFWDSYSEGDYWYGGGNPIDLHIVDNNDIYNDFAPEYETLSKEGPRRGFAAINLDLGGDGYGEVSGNLMHGAFEYGLFATSGEIDLTGDGNIIDGTNIGMGFYAGEREKGLVRVSPEVVYDEESGYLDYLGSLLRLTNNTIGETVFRDQADLFVDLGYGTFYAPGLPTLLNGLNARYIADGFNIDPASSGGAVTAAQRDYLESMIFHYVDQNDRGLFYFPLLSGIDQKDIFNNFRLFSPTKGGGSLIITGLPRVGGGAGGTTGGGGAGAGGGGFNVAGLNLNDISPAAGDEEDNGQPQGGSPANVEPAAGGDTNNAPCWSDATQSLGQGTPVMFNFGAGASELLQNAAACGTQPQQ